jgi:hypothetical protein
MSTRILGTCIIVSVVSVTIPSSAFDDAVKGKPKLEEVEIGARFGGRIALDIFGVNAEKGIITFVTTLGIKKGIEKKIQATKDCVCKVGYFRFGKPAYSMEGQEFAKGLRDRIFQMASPEKPLRVDFLTAQRDDDAKGIKKGDVVKVLVNPRE